MYLCVFVCGDLLTYVGDYRRLNRLSDLLDLELQLVYKPHMTITLTSVYMCIQMHMNTNIHVKNTNSVYLCTYIYMHE